MLLNYSILVYQDQNNDEYVSERLQLVIIDICDL